jgi:leucyl/phenylalanyl-tRNA--protein transferase
VPTEPPATRWTFGDPTAFDPDDDLVGVGADLEPGTLLEAYRHGLFPMPVGGRRSPMAWWSPVSRGVLPLDRLVVSRSLRRAVRDFEIRIDTRFAEVVAACADPRRPGAWIDSRIATAYRRLHELGWAHSVEAWQEDRLVGGLYGVAIGGLFAGESMFHRVTDASKVALVGLVEALSDEHADERLIDVQWVTPHLAGLGVTALPRLEYLRLLPQLFTVPEPVAFAGRPLT